MLVCLLHVGFLFSVSFSCHLNSRLNLPIFLALYSVKPYRWFQPSITSLARQTENLLEIVLLLQNYMYA